jgi:hypothetical protein
MADVPSIHFRRRWYYGLWCALLLASLVALGLWETPVRSGTADLTVKVLVRNVPPGCTASLWVGPKQQWPAADRIASMNLIESPLTPEGAAMGSLKLRVGYRRWFGGVIPRKTDDFLVVKFQPKVGAPRYFALSFEMDWAKGLLRPGRRMGISTTGDWDGLWQDPALIPKTS